MTGLVRASVLEGLDRIAARHGYPLEPILKSHGLSSSIFRSRDSEIDFANMCEILEDCAAQWQAPNLGIQLAQEHSLETLGVVSLVVRMETSVRAAVNAILRNLYLHDTGTIVSLVEQPDQGVAILHMNLRDVGRYRQASEMTLARAPYLFAELIGRPPEVLAAQFGMEAPKGRDYLSASLGTRVHYGASDSSITMRRSVFDTRITKQDVAFHPIIRRYLAEMEAEHAGSLSERVHVEVFRMLSLGECTQEKVAAAMRMQPRSLQRKLKAEGTSFREIVDEQRRKKALSLVQKTTLPLSEVALAVGYSDQTAFNQAFRRWFDTTPLKMRKEVVEA